MTTYTANRTEEMNAKADSISALNVGDGVSVSVWSDVDAFTIVKKTATTMTLRGDFQKLINREELVFHAGGFAAHCENQHVQRYEYSPNLDGHEMKITLRRWKDAEGNERRAWKKSGVGIFEQGGNVYAGRRAFYDFNF